MISFPRLRNLSLAALAASALSACVVAPYPREVYEPVVVGVAPPAPYVERIPAPPYSGAIWIGGHWGWREGRHHWVPGRYERPRPGHRWEPHRWTPHTRGGWQLNGGVWVR